VKTYSTSFPCINYLGPLDVEDGAHGLREVARERLVQLRVLHVLVDVQKQVVQQLPAVHQFGLLLLGRLGLLLVLLDAAAARVLVLEVLQPLEEERNEPRRLGLEDLADRHGVPSVTV